MKQENTNIFSLLLWQRFVIVGLTAAALVALPVFLYFSETKKDIDVTQREIKSIAKYAGINFYLVKPVREDDLLEKTQDLLEATIA